VTTKVYPYEKLEEISKLLDKAPTLLPAFIDHESLLNKIKPQIIDLHFNKHYNAKNITKFLKQNGIKTSVREVNELLKLSNNHNQTTDKSTNKINKNI